MAKINKTSDPYWDELWKKLGGTDGLRKLYYGEEAEMYQVSYKYKSTEGWFKRRLVDIYLWFKELLERGNEYD